MTIIVILVIWAAIVSLMVGIAFAAFAYALATFLPLWAAIGVVAAVVSFPTAYIFFARRF